MEDKNEAISSSIYYSIKQDEIVLNEQEALSKNPNITSEEINQVKSYLKSFSDNTIDQILEDSGYDPEEIKLDDTDLAHAKCCLVCSCNYWRCYFTYSWNNFHSEIFFS